jgi:hypothetical protein
VPPYTTIDHHKSPYITIYHRGFPWRHSRPISQRT